MYPVVTITTHDSPVMTVWGTGDVYMLIMIYRVSGLACPPLLLHTGACRPAMDPDDAQAIVAAASNDDFETVQQLVQQDRRLLDADHDGETPLVVAAFNDSVDMIDYLLQEGAQINFWSSIGWSALLRACHAGKTESVYTLLAYGADPTAMREGGITPLMTASRAGQAAVVALLLAHGCGDADYQVNGYLWSALHEACSHGRADVVRLLLEAGSDPHRGNTRAEWPQEYAARARHAECVRELEVRA
jgi:uncharacterized protein